MTKSRCVLFLTATLSLMITGCGSETGKSGSRVSGEVAFQPANVSITLGDTWLRIERKAPPPVCSPSLTSKAGMIHALAFEQDFPDAKKAADHLQKGFVENPKAVKESFKLDHFTSDNGLAGVHLTYAARSADDPFGPAKSRSHNFVVQNKAGKCISINYITDEGKDAETREMIRRTLKAL